MRRGGRGGEEVETRGSSVVSGVILVSMFPLSGATLARSINRWAGLYRWDTKNPYPVAQPNPFQIRLYQKPLPNNNNSNLFVAE